MRRTSSLIVGGGPAGAAAAITLARSGVKLLLIERNLVTGDSLCGGFLSWRSLETLRQLGLTPSELGGHTITHLRLFSPTGMGEAALPRPGIGVSRRRLDGVLLAYAEQAGAAVERGVFVRHAAARKVELTGGEVIHCDSLFLATGKHDCRGLQRPKSVEEDPVLGLRVRIPATAPLTRLLSNTVELHLFRKGYAGLLLQEGGDANLCIAVRKSRLTESAGKPSALLVDLAYESPRLAERLAHIAPYAAIDAIAAIPYGWRETNGVPGLFRLGDQAAVIPSFAGEGIGIALASGVLGAKWQISGGAAAAMHFQVKFAHLTARPVSVATWLNFTVQSRLGQVAVPMLLGAFPFLGTLVAEATRIR